MAKSSKANQEAVTKYSGLKTGGATRTEVSDTIKAEIKGIKAADLKAILDTIFKPAAASNGGGGASSKANQEAVTKQASPNDVLDLTAFDYKKLTTVANLKEYISFAGDLAFIEIDEETGKPKGITGSLDLNAEYDYVLLKAQPVMKERFPGVPDTPRDYTGLRILSDTPVHTSRMPVRVALQYNSQITNQHSMAGHGKYYFLKQ